LVLFSAHLTIFFTNEGKYFNFYIFLAKNKFFTRKSRIFSHLFRHIKILRLFVWDNLFTGIWTFMSGPKLNKADLLTLWVLNPNWDVKMTNTASMQSLLDNKIETVVCDIKLKFVVQRLNNVNIEPFRSIADTWCRFGTTVTKILWFRLQANERQGY